MNKEQLTKLIQIVKANQSLMQLFDALDQIGLKNYYIGAGAVTQSVWNALSGYPIDYGISDIDLVYFDDRHLEESHEQELKRRIVAILPDFPLWIDLKNQARVHIWYKDKFGYEIQPYESLEHAINTWPTTATSLGLRRENGEDWVVYAPFGIEDIFSMKIKANSRQITEEIYMKKVNKWTKKWSGLVYEPWSEIQGPIVHDRPIQFEYSI